MLTLLQSFCNKHNKMHRDSSNAEKCYQAALAIKADRLNITKIQQIF